MKKIATRVFLLACIFTTVILSSVYAMPSGYERIGKTNISSPVNIRKGPSTDYEIVGQLNQGDVVEVIEIESSGWYKILYKGDERYIYAEYIDTKTDSLYERIGSYKTYFDFNNTNRNHNINLASKQISIEVLPGHLFKWSEVIGPASKEQGYLLGNVIVGDEMKLDYGGGVCQVSSTLYNAALDANLEIIERHTHGLPVTYVPEGKDATVSYGYLDFVFRNNKDFPIQIIGFTGNGFVEIEIYNTSKKIYNSSKLKKTKNTKHEEKPLDVLRVVLVKPKVNNPVHVRCLR